jgi:glycolate oxidase
MSKTLIRDLAGQVSRSHVYTRPADLAAYAYDAFGASGDRHLPDAVVFPASTEEVAGVVQVCAHHGVPVVPRGAGTGYAQGAVAIGGGVVLCLTRMSRILGLEEDAMRIHVEAGVTTEAVHRRAAAAGLYYPPDPASASTSTIGGNVACNAAGPHGARYGTTGDYIAGATVVLGDGRVLRLGEGRDGGDGILRLLSGSEGTLGILTEVLLHLIPEPASRVTMAATFLALEGVADAVEAITAAGLVPAAMEFIDAGALDALTRAGISAGIDPYAAAVVIVEVEGDEARTAADAAACRAALERAGAARVEPARGTDEAAALWGLRRAASSAVATVMVGQINEDVVVPLHRIREALAATHEIGARHHLAVVLFGHLGNGVLHVAFLLDPRRAGERARADVATGELFEAVLGLDGSLTGEYGVGTAKLAFAERELGADQIELMRAVKASLDPGGVLNPGKKFDAHASQDSSARASDAP